MSLKNENELIQKIQAKSFLFCCWFGWLSRNSFSKGGTSLIRSTLEFSSQRQDSFFYSLFNVISSSNELTQHGNYLIMNQTLSILVYDVKKPMTHIFLWCNILNVISITYIYYSITTGKQYSSDIYIHVYPVKLSLFKK